MQLTMYQSPAEPTRTPENNCLNEAETVLDGQRYSARSRRGAPFALARALVLVGIPDRPVLVMHKGAVLTHPSWAGLQIGFAPFPIEA